MRPTIIAIDPGAKGGIAVYYGEGGCASAGSGAVVCHTMPETRGDVLELLREIIIPSRAEGAPVICFLELVGGYVKKKKRADGSESGGMPGSHAFNFGRGFGHLEGVLSAYGVKVEEVRPQDWQPMFHLGTASACATKTIWKNKLKSEAQRRFPQLGKKITLGTADALLILEYGRKTWGAMLA